MTGFFIPAAALGNFNLRIQTDLGGIDIELFDTVAPLTVANFMNYVNDGDYNGTFIHRSVPEFVVQGGGYIFNPDNGDFLGGGTTHIPTDPPVANEFSLSNVRGTIAMAKMDDDPDSATSEWFFNLEDNSTDLDEQNGGFTVFAQVLGDGMDVVDSIAALRRCIDVAPFPFFCGSLPDFPAADFDRGINNDTLINIDFIGFDNEGDGAIDELEDAGPNGGDVNLDGMLDSTQDNVASFPGSTGEYLTIEVSTGNYLQSLDVLGITFALANPPVTGILTDLEFRYGYAGFVLGGLVSDGTETAILTLPANAASDTFFVFGPTQDNPVPHWYEFLYDGETGAEINSNTITLHYADGKRGDSDLMSNGLIQVAPGGPAVRTGDGDGIAAEVENSAPNSGDGNNDGVLDSTQGNVASFVDINNNYITLETDEPLLLQSISVTNGAELFSRGGVSRLLDGFNLAHGFLGFNIMNVMQGNVATVNMLLPEGEVPETYFKFGPSPDNPAPHWYEFMFDGETGAEINDHIVTLHFVDGKRGDADLEINGIISDPGAPAFNAGNGGGGSGGGGCSLLHRAASPWWAGDWWLLVTFIVLLRRHGKRRRQGGDVLH
jgi:cyclophilin family peptidyl-prolyl cis-trans isomerase